MPVVKTSSKCQVVIPQAIRKKLGIHPGSKVVVTLSDDHVEIRPLPSNPIKALRGIFKEYAGSMGKELVDERRRDDRIDEKNHP